MSMKTSLLAATAIFVVGTGNAAAQSNEQMLRELQALQARMQELEAKLEAATAQAARAEAEAKQAAESSKNDMKVKWGPGPTISSADGRFSMHVRGRLFADYGYVNGEEKTNETNNAELRTARIGVEGKAWKDVKYKLEVDFADDEVDVKDATIGYRGFTVGQFKTQNSLEEQTSSRYITFMERAAFTDAFSLDRRIGLGYGFGGDQWRLGTGVFWQNTGTGTGGSGPDSFGAVSARAHYAFDLGDADAVHLGGSFRYRKCNNDASSSSACGSDQVRYRQRPFHHMTSVRHVNTGTLDGVTDDIIAGPEFAWVGGPLSIQGEGMYLWGSRDDETSSGTTPGDFSGLWGGYVDVSYFLTGESRSYSKSKGSFGRVKVKRPVFDGGMGAWQVAARLDYLDLHEPGDGITGGEQTSLIGGVNWHLNNHTRMMFDVSYTDVQDGPTSVNEADGSNEIWGGGSASAPRSTGSCSGPGSAATPRGRTPPKSGGHRGDGRRRCRGPK